MSSARDRQVRRRTATTPKPASIGAAASAGRQPVGRRSAPGGAASSLVSSFTVSATHCRKPNGPTRLGPSRSWKKPSTRRSTQVNTPAATSSAAISSGRGEDEQVGEPNHHGAASTHDDAGPPARRGVTDRQPGTAAALPGSSVTAAPGTRGHRPRAPRPPQGRGPRHPRDAARGAVPARGRPARGLARSVSVAAKGSCSGSQISPAVGVHRRIGKRVFRRRADRRPRATPRPDRRPSAAPPMRLLRVIGRTDRVQARRRTVRWTGPAAPAAPRMPSIVQPSPESGSGTGGVPRAIRPARSDAVRPE